MQLDGILTNFIAQLENIEMGNESVGKDICQTITLDQIIRVNASGDNENPVRLYRPVKRLIYLKIDADSWSKTVGVGKSSGTDLGLEFAMEYRVVDARLNVEKYLENWEKFNGLFQALTNANLQVFEKAVKTEPIKCLNPKWA